MEQGKAEGEGQTNLPQRVEDITTWVATVTGGIYGSQDPVAGALIGVEARNIGKTVRAIVETTQQRVGVLRLPRVLDGWSRVRRGIADREVEPDPRQVSDLIIEAEAVFADAATEAKRQAVADLIANAATSNGFVERVEALGALDLLRQMPDTAVVLFGCIFSEMEAKSTRRRLCREATLPTYEPYRGFSGVLVEVTVKLELDERWHLVAAEVDDDPHTREVRCKLLDRGLWLGRWIKAHPSNPNQIVKNHNR
jgi:hypothetical protein